MSENGEGQKTNEAWSDVRLFLIARLEGFNLEQGERVRAKKCSKNIYELDSHHKSNFVGFIFVIPIMQTLLSYFGNTYFVHQQFCHKQ